MKRIFLYKLEPKELELSFLKNSFSEVKAQFRVLTVFVIVSLCVFIAIDFSVVKESLHLIITVTLRAIAVMVTLTLSLFTPRIKEPKKFQIFTFLGVIVFVIHMIITESVRPNDQITIVAWSLIIIYTFYTAVPISLELRSTASLFYTAGTCFVWFAIKRPAWSATEIVTIIAAYVFANIFGFFFSNRLAVSRRHVFQLLNDEKSANKKLEAAIKEIKTLQGILPICAYCKKIRNDRGYWDQLERYLTDHTDAMFSHAVCPDCLKREHPDTYDSLVKKGIIIPSDS